MRYHFEPVYETSIEAFKALECWLYQCCEGELPELSKIYGFFSEFIKANWAVAIVQQSGEYDAAEWG